MSLGAWEQSGSWGFLLAGREREQRSGFSVLQHCSKPLPHSQSPSSALQSTPGALSCIAKHGWLLPCSLRGGSQRSPPDTAQPVHLEWAGEGHHCTGVKVSGLRYISFVSWCLLLPRKSLPQEICDSLGKPPPPALVPLQTGLHIQRRAAPSWESYSQHHGLSSDS